MRNVFFNTVNICCLLLLANILNAQAVTLLRIDPANARGGTTADIFDEVNFIPLETTKESLFGKIDQLELTDKYFIVLDNSNTNCILIFDRSGKFHAKIDGGNYLFNVQKNYGKRISSFRINPSTHQIEVRTSGSQNIFYYNLDGQKLGEKKAIFNMYDYCYLSDNMIAVHEYYVDGHNKDSVAHEISVIKDGKIFREYLPYNRKTDALTTNELMGVGGSVFYNTGRDTTAYFVRPYDYAIYEITPHSLKPGFNFMLPLANTLPPHYRTDTVFNGKRFKIFQEDKNLVFYIGYPYLFGDNLFFKLDNWGGLNNKSSFLYNLKSGNLFCIERIAPDSTTGYLPVTDAGLNVDFANSNFQARDSAYLYTSYSSLIMFEQKELVENKHPHYPPALQRYFSAQDRKSNPVIVQLKPKKSL